METFALVILLVSAPPCSPVPTWQSPGCGMPSVITEGLTKSECEQELAATLNENPGAEAYCLRR
jgi:hypothetical protein